ncbi:ferredoxin [Mycobacterium sp. NPDC006124]|uniref:ferredoxin n=1 Tax=Mycobacterium sp. NPDC006124 TaxID=3156729 RepID=UPI0033BAFA19
MRVVVDDGACAGHGACVAICPEVFALTDDGYAEAVLSEIPPHLQASVDEAIDASPERAITTTKD